MDDTDRKIINRLQQGFPVCDSPYQLVAAELDLTRDELLKRLQTLLDDGVLSRFGPMYHAERLGGGLTLAAIEVPETIFEQTVAIVNAFPEVAHNYRRGHRLNMWFVIAADSSERIAQIIKEIERRSGLIVYNMPKIKEYYVGLQLEA